MNGQSRWIRRPVHIVSAVVFLLLAGVYALSRCPGGDPAAPWGLINAALETSWLIPRRAPFWIGLAAILGRVAPGAVLPALQALSIVCAALCGALVCSWVAGFDPPETKSLPRGAMPRARAASPSMLIAGALAGLTFGIYPAFWSEAIRGMPGPLHMLMLLVCMHLLRIAIRRQKRGALYLLCFLYSAGMANYPTMIVLLPLFGFLILLLSSEWEETRGSELVRCVLCGLVGGLAFLILPLVIWLGPYRQVHQLSSFGDGLLLFLTGEWVVIKVAIFSFIGILPLCFCLAPYLLFVLMPRNTTGWWGKFGASVLKILFTLVGGFILLGFPIDLQTLYPGYPVIFPVLITAMWFSYLVGEWLAALAREWREGDRLAALAFTPLAGWVVLPLLIAAGYLPWLNRRPAGIAHDLVRVVQQQLPPDTAFVWVDPSPTWLDGFLQYRLWQTHHGCHVINIALLPKLAYQDYLRARSPAVAWPKAENTLRDEWLRALLDIPDMRGRVAVLADPEAIQTCGYDVLPQPFFYLALERRDPAAIADAWQRTAARLQELEPRMAPLAEALLAGRLEAPRLFRPGRQAEILVEAHAGTTVVRPLLQHVSRYCNDIGFFLVQSGRTEDAVSALTAALQVVPGNPSALANLYQIREDNPDLATPGGRMSAMSPEQLREHFTQSLAQEAARLGLPDASALVLALPSQWGLVGAPNLFLQLSRLYLERLGNPQRALYATRMARELAGDQNRNASTGFLAELLMMAGEPEEAREELEKLVAAEPQNTAARYRLATIYLQLSLFDRAREALEGVEGDDAAVVRTLAEALGLVQSGDMPGAVACLDAAAESLPEAPAITVLLARIQTEAGNFDAARTQLARARRQGWSPVLADTLDAWIALSRGSAADLERARVLVERLLEQSPDSPEALWLSINLQIVRGNLAQAQKPAERLTELEPTAARGFAALGFIHMQLGNQTEAIRRYERAATLEESALVLNNLANLYAMRGTPSLALETARNGIALFPDDPYLNDTLAEILEREGDLAGAVAHSRIACQNLRDVPDETKVQLLSHLASLLGRSPDPGLQQEAAALLREAERIRAGTGSESSGPPS